MNSGKVSVARGEDYGYGCIIDKIGKLVAVGHTGQTPGTVVSFTMFPQLGYTVVVLSNYDVPAAERISVRIRSLLAGQMNEDAMEQRAAVPAFRLSNLLIMQPE
jgi:CubicO group peptidase (beta-lactamase class C family)